MSFRNNRLRTCRTSILYLYNQADIVISCAGHKELVKGEWIKQGAKVIDVGITRLAGTNKLIGDIEYAKVYPIISRPFLK